MYNPGKREVAETKWAGISNNPRAVYRLRRKNIF